MPTNKGAAKSAALAVHVGLEAPAQRVDLGIGQRRRFAAGCRQVIESKARPRRRLPGAERGEDGVALMIGDPGDGDLGRHGAYSRQNCLLTSRSASARDTPMSFSIWSLNASSRRR